MTKRKRARRGTGTNLTIVPDPSLPGAGAGRAQSAGARGRILYVEDVQDLLGRNAQGKPRRSSWWVRMHVAPDRKFYLGQLAAWYEADVLAWLDEIYERQTA